MAVLESSSSSVTISVEGLNRAVFEAAEKLGVKELKPKQHEAIVSYVTGNDTFVVLPTGYGKSLIYAILPVIFDKLRGNNCYYDVFICIVCNLGTQGSIVTIVSPLTALMLDQKKRFSLKGLSVEYIGEAQKDENALSAVMQGKVQLVYMSPESMLCNWKVRKMFSSTIYQNNLVGFRV